MQGLLFLLVFSSVATLAQLNSSKSQHLQSTASESQELQARIDEAARALAAHQHLKGISEQRIQPTTEFVAGNMLFVLVHELGHATISDMTLPVLGRMEDAADAFAATTMLKMGTNFSQRVLVEAAKGWFLSAKSDQAQGETIAYYDAHSLDKQRAYQIVCLMVGSDPEKFKDLANETGLPEDRQQTCPEDYSNASWSWQTELNPHRRKPEQLKQKIEVVYGDGQGKFDLYAQAFRSIKLLDVVAEHAADQYIWQGPFALKMQSCGASNAHWYMQAREVILCYDLAADFAKLYRDYGPNSASLGVH
jgi:hypothetical protein